ncbi:hypothetical protein ABKN59_001815 [Abortiporus biennis]
MSGQQLGHEPSDSSNRFSVHGPLKILYLKVWINSRVVPTLAVHNSFSLHPRLSEPLASASRVSRSFAMSSFKLSAVLGQNKPRIYTAYYARAQQNPTDERYHVSLLVRPHPYQDHLHGSFRLHAVNKIVPPTEELPIPHEEWRFEVLTNVKFKTDKLRGLLYLGKLPDGKSVDDVSEACAKVPVPQYNPSEASNSATAVWRCTNWLWDALDVIVQEGLISSFPNDISGKDAWQIGREFVTANESQDGQIVCCDIHGRSYDYTK